LKGTRRAEERHDFYSGVSKSTQKTVHHTGGDRNARKNRITH